MIIITAIIFSYYFIEMARLPKKWKLDFKPFNCMVCLPVWVSLFLYLCPSIVQEVTFQLMASGVGAGIFYILMKRLFDI